MRFLVILYPLLVMTAYANLPHRVNVLKQKKDQAIFSSLGLVYKEYSKSLLKLQTELVASNQLTDANAVQSEFFLNTSYIDLIGKSYQFVFDRHRPLPAEAKIYRQTRNEKAKIALKKNLMVYIAELKKAQVAYMNSQNLVNARKATDEMRLATLELRKIDTIVSGTSSVTPWPSSGKPLKNKSFKLGDGLVAWWKFDETSGTVAYDSSGNGNNGTLTSGPTWISGKIEGALSFDGVDDYVKVKHSDELSLVNSCSIALWIKISRKTASGSLDSDANLFSKRLNLVNYEEAYALKVFGPDRDNRGRAEFGTNASTFTPPWHAGSSIVDTNDWYHLTVAIDNQSVRIYINSLIDSESSYTGQLSSSEQPIFIGIKADMTRAVKGIIDDVRIYDRALSASEVQALYKLGQ
jgi:hypothetical protein